MLNLGAGTNLGSAYGSVEIGTDDAERNITGLVASVQGAARSMSSAFGDMGKSIQNFGDGMKNVGESMTKWISLPLVGVATAAVKFSTDFNGAMANVASLGLVPERVQELKGSVQDMAIEFGQSTGNMADGLYQLVSAYGDTEDTQESLRINTQAAAAGLATLEESIALTSAVTKGYGDTSAESQQKVADLAFQTVKLGQTTFPELAASMGRVVPVAAELGETQEALFGKLATLTGVTGTAAEVNTQLRATYQAFLAPSEAMAGAIANIATRLDQQGKLAAGPLVDAWKSAKEQMWRTQDQIAMLGAELQRTDKSTDEGAKRAKELEKAIKEQEKALKDNQDAVREAAAGLGKAVVQSQGFDATLQEVTASADGNTAVLQDMFGSIEALNAVLALGGGQQDTYTEKLQQMSTASGAAEEAFKAQTEGINELGFTMAQVRTRVEVMAQKLGDGLAPTLMDVLDAAEPLIDALLKMADQFANMDKEQQKQIITIAAVAVAIGPVVTALGTMISVGGTLVSGIGGIISVISGGAGLVASLGAILNPVGLVVAAVAGLGIAWATDFGGIRTKTIEVTNQVGQTISTWSAAAVNKFKEFHSSTGATLSSWSSSIGSTFSSMSSSTGATLSSWASSVGSKFTQMKDNAISRAGEMLRDVVDRLSRLVSDGLRVFDVGKWIKAGGDIIGGVMEGLARAATAPLRWIENFASGLIGLFTSRLGIHSPSTVFAEYGQNIMDGLGGGLESRSSAVLGYMGEFSNALVATAEEAQRQADKAFKQLTDTATAAYNGYVATVNSMNTLSQDIDQNAIDAQNAAHAAAIAAGQQQAAQSDSAKYYGEGRVAQLISQITEMVDTSFRQIGNNGVQSLGIDLSQFTSSGQLSGTIDQLKLLSGTISQNASNAPDAIDRDRLSSLYMDVTQRIIPLLQKELDKRAESTQQNILGGLTESAKAAFDTVSNSIRQFVLGTFSKLGMSEADIKNAGGAYAAAKLGFQDQAQEMIGGILNQLLALQQTTSADVIGQGLDALINYRSQYNQTALDFYGAGAANTDRVYSDLQDATNGQQIYNFYLDYQTQQSAGSVGQDVALLNALYGGT